ncbi:Uncharacterised protein [Bordetella pertussis]|nr:Uncharacterised protein [Bordetella pertussis]CPK87593.1 Uncharacterised protein [Bordetella pertussis]CPN30863.1 Uncharacterised protein [Bordetella pertussis]
MPALKAMGTCLSTTSWGAVLAQSSTMGSMAAQCGQV